MYSNLRSRKKTAEDIILMVRSAVDFFLYVAGHNYDGFL